MNIPQRTLSESIEPIGVRGNRDLGNIQSSIGNGPLQTMPSSEGHELARHHLLEEDYDEEMQNMNHNGIHQRVTNYEYAQTQEEKHLQQFMDNMPENQIVSSYVTLN